MDDTEQEERLPRISAQVYPEDVGAIKIIREYLATLASGPQFCGESAAVRFALRYTVFHLARAAQRKLARETLVAAPKEAPVQSRAVRRVKGRSGK